jgi:inner membrane protein involved in colicin E2 resistance
MRHSTFEMKLGLVGQDTLAIAPIADDTTAHLTSPWAHPSFGGRFLAAQRNVTPQGFDAQWRISSLVTSAREQVRAGLSGRVDGSDAAAVATASSARPQRNLGPLQTFDVSLAQPINVYSMSTRAGKYGMLFIGLVLMAAFMFELFRKLRLHPIQYGLVGLSIALFFLLLLALSEKFAFWIAYASCSQRQRCTARRVLQRGARWLETRPVVRCLHRAVVRRALWAARLRKQCAAAGCTADLRHAGHADAGDAQGRLVCTVAPRGAHCAPALAQGA